MMPAAAVPDNAKWHDQSKHHICPYCGGPKFDNSLVSDLIQRSLESVKYVRDFFDENPRGMAAWLDQRGAYDGEQDGKGIIDRNRASPISGHWARARDHARKGLSNYGTTNRFDFRPDGQHIMEAIFAQTTGSPARSSKEIFDFIKKNRIKGHTDAHVAHGGLSDPSKMHGGSDDLPTAACKVGAHLRGIEGTPCSGCYADQGNMRYAEPQRKQWDNLIGLANPQMYGAALSYQIGNHMQGHRIRFLSSGDLQSASHLSLLADVARAHPEKQFWLPTREHNDVLRFLMDNGGLSQTGEWSENALSALPPNLAVRLSAPEGSMESFDMMHQSLMKHPQVSASTMNHAAQDPTVHLCPAAGKKGEQGKCATHHCDACWDPSIQVIDYTGHGSRNVLQRFTPGSQEWDNLQTAQSATQERILNRSNQQVLNPASQTLDLDLSAFNMEGLQG